MVQVALRRLVLLLQIFSLKQTVILSGGSVLTFYAGVGRGRSSVALPCPQTLDGNAPGRQPTGVRGCGGTWPLNS